jgi:hypothetical protein
MRRILLSACLLAMAVYPGDAQAQLGLGVQGSWAQDADFGIGAIAAVQLPVDQFPMAFAATFDWFFPKAEDIDDYWEINANLLATPALEVITGYFGVGLNLAHMSGPDPFGGRISETNVGINILGGVMYDAAILMPFAEARYEIKGGEQLVLTLGIMVAFETFTGIR